MLTQTSATKIKQLSPSKLKRGLWVYEFVENSSANEEANKTQLIIISDDEVIERKRSVNPG